MITVPEQVLDKIMHLPEDKISILTEFLETLYSDPMPKADVSRRIGIAKSIEFPADFDDIDYGTMELFGLLDEP